MTWAQERRKANNRARESRQRRAELRVLIDGRWVASADGITPLPPDRHGLPGTYSNWMCRCAPCTTVATAYMKEYAQKQKDKR